MSQARGLERYMDDLEAEEGGVMNDVYEVRLSQFDE